MKAVGSRTEGVAWEDGKEEGGIGEAGRVGEEECRGGETGQSKAGQEATGFTQR